MQTQEVVPNVVRNYVPRDEPDGQYFVRGIPSPLVETFWHYASPFLKRALDFTDGELQLTDLRQLCVNRDMQLWVIAQPDRVVGAGTTEIVVFPHRKYLRIITLSGKDFDKWMPAADKVMQDFARANGCDALECFTRIGFQKKLDTIGYKLKHCVMLKELGP